MSLWDLKQKIFNHIANQSGIWTLSLWDLKRWSNSKSRKISTFELCPYGIWNQSRWNNGNALCHLNFVPMGFETRPALICHCFPRYLNFVPMGFETTYVDPCSICEYDLNFVPMGFETSSSTGVCDFTDIWTLSLWDLKLEGAGGGITLKKFELCPYGIWN